MSYHQLYYQTHREKIIAQAREWQKQHPERVKEYREKNKEKYDILIKRWRENNREHLNQYSREYLRAHCVSTINGRIYDLKRPYPKNGCELCGRSRKLHYHHYDDANLMKGMWLCIPCHNFVEQIDEHEDLVKKYFKLRMEVCA